MGLKGREGRRQRDALELLKYNLKRLKLAF